MAIQATRRSVVEYSILKYTQKRNPSTGRWGVKLSTVQELAVRPSNLMPMGKNLNTQITTDRFFILAYDGASGYDKDREGAELVQDDDPETLDVLFSFKY
jgi:hypothetical protein